MHRRHRKLHQFLVPIALALSALLAAAPTSLAAGADVYGVGGGSINLPTGQKFVKFAFSGHTGPQGDFGSYRWTVEDPNFPLDVRGDVDCVNVSAFGTGAGGWIGGPVTRVTPYPNAYGVDPGEENVLGINDFGNPSGAMPDEFNAYTENQGAFSQICKLLGPFSQTPISQGNINIKLPS